MGCKNCKPNPCPPKKNCACLVKDLYTSCVSYDGEALSCTGIDTPDTLDIIIKKIDTAICSKFNSITNFISLTNIGSGAEIYKQISNIGEKELRTLVSNDGSITITETTDEIDFSVDIPEAKTITSDDSSVTITEDTTTIDLSVDTPEQNDVVSFGTGNPVYVGQNGNDDYQISTLLDASTQDHTPTYLGYTLGNHRFAGIKSDTLTITTDELGNIQLENPNVTDSGIPRFIVNNTYTGTEELGTIAKPFKTIQGAVDEVIGSGTADSPEFNNALIIIQRGNNYTFTGNFSVRNLSINVEQGAFISHNPLPGEYLIDYDILNQNNSETTLTLEADSKIVLTQKGFKNSGKDNTGFKTININGASTGSIEATASYDSTFSIIESNYDNNSNLSNSAGGAHFNVDNVYLLSRLNPIYKVGGQSKVYFNNCTLFSSLISLTVNPNLKAFDQVGGAVFCDKTLIGLNGGVRNTGFSLEQGNTYQVSLRLNRCEFQGNTVEKLIENFSGEAINPTVEAYFNSSRFITIGAVFYNSTGTWTGVKANRNAFENGDLANSAVDLTRNNTSSVTNSVGMYLINNLVEYPDKSTASTAGLPTGAMFLNTTTDTIDIVT